MERFKKENLEIVWNESKCIHAGICVKMLPKVYRPEETPWIHADCASKEEIVNQVSQCPSGALTIENN
ncbi:(4Fe-4S)-binding protein [Gelidibacter japonicus]|uniref:(4Fe-4S)-binding protein n=1 Tax=Gelidibacter japonicus TaxID=1962232 RepID=UPI002AFE01D0|nr:(4Fe-4S)-binding protein [Gelidibacter japonicus]